MVAVADRVVLITGVSSGIGKELAAQLLDRGARVAGTFRSAEEAESFSALRKGRSLGLYLDLTDRKSIRTAVATASEHFGQIDVLANNAGAGTVGAVEETSDELARHIFDVNFFGGLSVARAVLPVMRRQRSGHILQFSAIGGFIGYPGLGVYSAAKGATDIVGEAMAAELSPLGIYVTVLTIGVFHTEFAGASLVFSEPAIDDYSDTPAGQFRQAVRGLQGNQPNDAAKGAAAIIELIEADEPPVHAALGADALGGMRAKMARIEGELRAWEENSRSTKRDDS